MGQQQLLLLVLGAIIVGLAIVVGINLFGQGALKANEDNSTQDMLTMLSRIEEWYRKPVMLGGGGKSLAALADFSDIGYEYNSDGSATSTTYANDNGLYTLSVAGAIATVSCQLAEDPGITINYTITCDPAVNGPAVIGGPNKTVAT